MTDNTGGDGRSLGEAGLDAAKDAVDVATEKVDELGRHIKRKVEAARKPETYIEMLKDMTKAAPLGMLAVAFIGGMLFARCR